MDPNEKLERFIADLGVVAETSLAYFRLMINTGATENEAYLLTRAFLAALLESEDQKKEE